MNVICCPACGHVLMELRATGITQSPSLAAPPGSDGGTVGPSGSGSPGLPRCYFEKGKWSIDCPQHGYHAATVLQARDGKPAVVKCVASGPDGYCNTRVPLEEAKRMAGIGVT